MKEYTTDKLRNVCLAGQRGSGKTSLADAIAFVAGINNRVGKVDDGSSLMDYNDGELSRKTTLSSKLLAFEWNNTKINLFDTPGHSDFVGEMVASARVTDAVCFLVDGVAGVEVGTQVQWRMIDDSNTGRFFLVNKFDRENVNWDATVDSIQSAFNHAIPVHLPIGAAETFKGLVDLLKMKAYTFDDKGSHTEADIPADMKAEADAAREALIEAAAESNDALLEKFFEKGTLSEADLVKGVRTGIAAGKLFPILVGSGSKNHGTAAFMDFVAGFIPSPDMLPAEKATKQTGDKSEFEIPFKSDGDPVAFVFKMAAEGHLGDMTYFRTISGKLAAGQELMNQQTSTSERVAQIFSFQGKNRIEIPSASAGDIGVLVKLKGTGVGHTLAHKGYNATINGVVYPNPVTDVAIKPKKRGDEEKIASGLNRLAEEDPTFRLVADAALHQQVLWGQGSTHIEVLLEKLKVRNGVEADLARPKIPYRETIKGKAEQQYRHKKQSGGRGQFGDVHIRIEPNERGAGFEFLDEVTGGVIPSKFIPAVEKGVVESMVNGGLCGAQVVDVKVALFFGSYHDVDSSDMAFKIAGLMAFREAYLQAKPVILEPIYNLEILVPDDFTGDVMGDLSSRRGKIAGMDPDGRNQRIRASIPQAELYQYSVDLRSMTQGQGVYTMEFSHYEEVPHDAAQKIIEEAKREKEEEAS